MRVTCKLFLIVLSVFIVSCSENIDTFYADIHDSRLVEAIGKGWVPGILPGSAREIYETHNLDTNRVWMKFKFSSADIKIMIKKLKMVSQDEMGKMEFHNPGVKWWPKHIDRESLVFGSSNELSLYKYYGVVKYSDGKESITTGFF